MIEAVSASSSRAAGTASRLTPTTIGKVWINDFLKASAEHAAGKRRGEIRPPVLFGEKRGAGEGNRTLIISLEVAGKA
jgi:hypothetical protein